MQNNKKTLMYDENKTIKIKCGVTEVKHLRSMGYDIKKRGEEIEIKIKDLLPTSTRVIDATCDYCGSVYRSQFSVLFKGRSIGGKNACSKCAGIKAQELNMKRLAIDKFRKLRAICDTNNYVLLTKEEEYNGAQMSIRFLCQKHGEQKMMLDNILRGHKCPQCGNESRGISNRLDIDEIIQKINSTNGNTYLNPEEYTDSTSRCLLIRCACGAQYRTSYENFLRHGKQRCSACSARESSGEMAVRKKLEEMGINYIQEYRFEDCKDKRPMPFDFYLPDLSVVIEFDGKQHFEDVTYFPNCDSSKMHDELKNNYCLRNNIKIIRIPYWEKANIDNILERNLA